MLRRVLQVAFIVLVGGLAFLYLRLDGLVKTGIETYGTRILKARVSVSGVRLSPFSGEGSIRGLEIGSPAGFSEPYVLRVGSVRVRVDPKSLTKERVVVREIAIEEPELRYERKSSGSNLDALQRNAASYSSAPEPESGGKKEAGKPRKLVIDRFTARGGKAVLAVFGARAIVPLPDVTATGIGEGGGATPQQAAQRILEALSDAALKAVGSSKTAVGNIGGAINNALKGLFGR